MRSSLKALIVLASSLAALASAPAWGLQRVCRRSGPEVYCGKYRGGFKTTFYKTPDGRKNLSISQPR